MEYRLMEKEELNRASELDRREVIKHIYYYRDGKLDLVEEYWDVPEWSNKKKEQIIQYLVDTHDAGGVVYGAFTGSKVAGIASLDKNFIGSKKDQLNLAGLWVSRDYRKQGVANQLVKIVKEKARAWGAKKLYVSATPSKNTVDFYMNLGFRLAEEIDRILFDKEPEDIHMDLVL
ncbi:MAG: GNAT family N-acetyltransferase [Candidatus Kariarchaeaceae archaeon]|jgi:N-acetylglutamate synthase-like GNAT family acetyltransferase